MKSLSAIIADDAERDRSLIRAIVQNHCPELNVVAETDTLTSTFEAVCRFKPDLLFLDIEFNELDKTGFNLIDDLLNADALSCHVIFISGYLADPTKPYALYALRYAALPVLEKPIRIPKLRMAVEQALLMVESQNREQLKKQYEIGISMMKSGDSAHKPLMIRTSSKTYVQVHTADIIYIATDPEARSTTFIYFRNSPEIRTYERIGFYDFLVEKNPNFMRVHQSHTVNRTEVKHYDAKSRKMTLRNGDIVDVARQKEAAVRRWLGEM